MQPISTNIQSLFVQGVLAASGDKVNSAIQQLSTGVRINSAADDAAGYAISQRMSAQINGFDQAGENANDGISLLQVADGAIAQMTANFQTIRTLAVEAANSTYTSSDRQAMQTQVDQLLNENIQISQQTNFNGTNLLDGTFTSQQLQIGANPGQILSLSIPPAFSASSGSETVQAPLQQATVSGQTVGAIFSGDLTVDGVAIGASQAGALTGQASDSAWSIAHAISNANIATITASANTSITSTIGSAGNFSAGALSINGVALSAFSGINGSDLAASLANAINGVGGSTGVTASASSSGHSATLTLTAADGRNIDFSQTVAGVEQALGLASTQGTVTLTTTASPVASEIQISGNNPQNAGLAPGLFHSVDSGGTVPVSIAVSGQVADVTSAANAGQAIIYIDAQLQNCSTLSDYLGTTQNVLQSIYTNLSASAVNLKTAQSRIEDTDYAAATSTLINGQILKSAGTAMLAQANTDPGRLIKLLIG